MSHIIRIVSDLHLGHRASLLEKLEDMRPLADGADEMVFNGDTLELKYGDLNAVEYNAAEQKAKFDAEVANWGIATRLITGNHDPAISDTHHLLLAHGSVLVTHGDGLFREIAPWSSSVTNLRRMADALGIDENATGEPDDLGPYLALHKRASIEAHKRDDGYNPTMWGRAKIFLHQTWPPTTPFKVLNCWRQVPGRAVSLAHRFGLAPRFIVLGHTHLPGHWRRGDQHVINLGSYFPWPGARCVDIDMEQETLAIRSIRKRQGEVRIGPAVATFHLPRQANLATGSLSIPKEAAG